MSDPTPVAPRSRKRASGRGDEQVGVTAADDAVVGDVDGVATPGALADDPLGRAEAQALAEAHGAVDPGPVLRLERGGIAEATAGRVEVRLGGIGALTAEDVFVEWGGVGAARADRLSVEFGSVGAALAGEARVTQGFAGSIAAREATLEQGIVRTLIAQHVVVNRPSAVLVMIAQHVSGDVRPLLDWRGALVAGAAFGLVAGVFRVLRDRD